MGFHQIATSAMFLIVDAQLRTFCLAGMSMDSTNLFPMHIGKRFVGFIGVPVKQQVFNWLSSIVGSGDGSVGNAEKQCKRVLTGVRSSKTAVPALLSLIVTWDATPLAQKCPKQDRLTINRARLTEKRG